MAGIFLSYRREDSAGHTGRLYDNLVSHFGKRRVFLDTDTIAKGANFLRAIDVCLKKCDVTLVVIGPKWSKLFRSDKSTGSDQTNDYVRLEIEKSLSAKKIVIPVLVGGAAMPSEAELPASLSELHYQNALIMSDVNWHSDLLKLINEINSLLKENPEEKLGKFGEGVTEMSASSFVRSWRGFVISCMPSLLFAWWFEGNNFEEFSSWFLLCVVAIWISQILFTTVFTRLGAASADKLIDFVKSWYGYFSSIALGIVITFAPSFFFSLDNS